MSFSDAIRSVISKYADFSGRARRSEYWYFCLANYLISAILAWLGLKLRFFRTLEWIYSLAVIVPGLAVTWRRLHDVGRSGGYAFMILVPLAGPILLLVRLCTDSEPGSNRFGLNPKYPDPDEYVEN